MSLWETPRQGRGWRWHRDRVGFWLILTVLPVVCVVGIVLVPVSAGRAMSAARGHGEAGTFVAQETTVHGRGPRFTRGYFVPDGSDAPVEGVTMHGPHLPMGAAVPAIRRWDTRQVYVRGSWSYAVWLWLMWVSAWFFLIVPVLAWSGRRRGARTLDEAEFMWGWRRRVRDEEEITAELARRGIRRRR